MLPRDPMKHPADTNSTPFSTRDLVDWGLIEDLSEGGEPSGRVVVSVRGARVAATLMRMLRLTAPRAYRTVVREVEAD